MVSEGIPPIREENKMNLLLHKRSLRKQILRKQILHIQILGILFENTNGVLTRNDAGT
jgi:hypothetical protein